MKLIALLSALFLTACHDHASQMVFIGDSITAGWATETLVPGSINAGVPGQQPCAMLDRFDADVLAHHPGRIHILGGTNSILDDNPPQSQIDCVLEMARRGVASGAAVYVGTVLPSGKLPRAGIEYFNAQLRIAAPAIGFKILDYYPAMFTGDVYFDQSLYIDLVHPNAAGYERMEAVFRKVVK